MHGGGGVGAYGADMDIFAQRLGDAVRDEGVARKGIVQPPQHWYKGAVQGVHHRRFHHRVGQHKVCAGGQSPQGTGGNAVRAGDHGGTGVQKQLQRALVRRAQHYYLKAKAAQHRHGAYQHDGRAGHGQLVAQDQRAASLGGEYVLGAQLPAEVQQRLRDAAAVLRHGVGQAQQLGNAVPAPGGGAHLVQQCPGHHGAAAAGQVPGAQVQGGRAVKAKGGIADCKVCTLPQGSGKIGQGGRDAFHILAHQQHPCHIGGQLALQRSHQTELAVQLVLQRRFQRLVTPRRIDQKIGALGIGIGLLGQLLALQGTVTGVHRSNSSGQNIGRAQWPRSRVSSLRSGAVSRQLLLARIVSSET